MQTFTRPFAIAFLFGSALIGQTGCNKDSGVTPGTDPQDSKPKVLRTERLSLMAGSFSTNDAERARMFRKGPLRGGLPYYFVRKDTVKLQPANWTITKLLSDLGSYVSQSTANSGKRVKLGLLPSEDYERTYAYGVNILSSETSADIYSGLVSEESTEFALYDLKIAKTFTLDNGTPMWLSQEIKAGSGEYLEIFISLRGPALTVNRVKDVVLDSRGVLAKHTILERQSLYWALQEVPTSTTAGGRVGIMQPVMSSNASIEYDPLKLK